MKKDTNSKAILILVIILFVLLIICMLVYLYIDISTIQNDNSLNISYIDNENEEINPVKDIIEKYDSKYLSEKDDENYEIYVNFGKDLYDEQGNSNEKYFAEIIEELETIINSEFTLIDEEKNINIRVAFDKDTDDYINIYNDNKNFYDEVNGKSYIDLNELKIVDKIEDMNVTDSLLSNLEKKNMMLNSINENLGDGKELENGYTSYLDNSILIKSNNGRVRNIIFTDKYEGEIVKNIKIGTSLKDIIEEYPKVAFGSVDEGYLGYRTEYNYIFFYKDEVSIWEYFYYNNITFEEYLSEYFETNDLKKFIDNITKGWSNYKFYKEYDPTTNSVHIIYPTRGIEINIENEDKKEIIIYSNYYITDTMRKFAEEGKIIIKGDEDSIKNEELQRRNS